MELLVKALADKMTEEKFGKDCKRYNAIKEEFEYVDEAKRYNNIKKHEISSILRSHGVNKGIFLNKIK